MFELFVNTKIQDKRICCTKLINILDKINKKRLLHIRYVHRATSRWLLKLPPKIMKQLLITNSHYFSPKLCIED